VAIQSRASVPHRWIASLAMTILVQSYRAAPAAGMVLTGGASGEAAHGKIALKEEKSKRGAESGAEAQQAESPNETDVPPVEGGGVGLSPGKSLISPDSAADMKGIERKFWALRARERRCGRALEPSFKEARARVASRGAWPRRRNARRPGDAASSLEQLPELLPAFAVEPSERLLADRAEVVG